MNSPRTPIQTIKIENINLKRYLVKPKEHQWVWESATRFIKDNDIGKIEVPLLILEFIDNLIEGRECSPQMFQDFSNAMQGLQDNDVHDFIVGLLRYGCTYRYCDFYRNDIGKLIEKIKKGNLNPEMKLDNVDATSWKNLLQMHRALSILPSTQFREDHDGFPKLNFNSVNEAILNYELRFSLNVLRLVKKMPRAGRYLGVPLAEPFYPDKSHEFWLKINLQPKPGIKDANKYYPIERVKKEIEGLSGNTNFLVVDDRGKLLFLRNTIKDARKAVLASKIATVISKKHFASERLFSNGFSASKKLAAYQDSLYREGHDKLIVALRDKKTIEGAGICDEVLKFIGESDFTALENIGVDAEDEKIILCKIDYDLCDIWYSPEESYPGFYYKNDLLTWIGEYPGLRQTPEYLRETYYARLKLSLFSKKLLEALCEKAGEPIVAKNIEILCKRIDFVYDGLCRDPRLHEFVSKGEVNINEIHDELVTYVKKHFKDFQCEEILLSLQARKEKLFPTRSAGQYAGLGATLGLALGVYLFPVAGPVTILALVCAGLVAGGIRSCGFQSTAIVASSLGIKPQRHVSSTAASSSKQKMDNSGASTSPPLALSSRANHTSFNSVRVRPNK